MSAGDPLQQCPKCGGFLFWPDEEPPALWCDCPKTQSYPNEFLDPSEVPGYYDSDESEPGE